MWSFLIVELLPFHSHHIQIKCLVRQIYKIPKLCLIGLLRPFDFAIQMRSPWFDWSEFDKMVMQFILYGVILVLSGIPLGIGMGRSLEEGRTFLLEESQTYAQKLYFPLFYWDIYEWFSNGYNHLWP